MAPQVQECSENTKEGTEKELMSCEIVTLKIPVPTSMNISSQYIGVSAVKFPGCIFS